LSFSRRFSETRDSDPTPTPTFTGTSFPTAAATASTVFASTSAHTTPWQWLAFTIRLSGAMPSSFRNRSRTLPR